MKKITGILLFLLLYASASAQFYPTQYRPPNLQWQQLETPHFKIVFPSGEDSVAWRTGRILESEYNKVQDLADGKLSDFPVILNNYNDRSNGFVTPFHFRSEIEIPPIKGKALNPQSGNWLEAVEPHELVHALHYSNTGGFGIGGLVNLFSPDLARSFHSAIPSGITEGLATYHETEFVAPNGGRGNHPYFYNQFNAVFDSQERWTMGQMSHFPEHNRPFNRHYIGGYEFTRWLQDTYGRETTRKALNFYIDLPFLGYGVALKHATGKWPATLYNEFEKSVAEERSKDTIAQKPIPTLGIPLQGASVHRPKWLDPNTLIFYASFYNGSPGFYTYDLNSGNLTCLVTTNSVTDYLYDLSDDKSTITYAYYRSSALYDRTYLSELVEVNLKDQSQKRLSQNGRVYAPEISGQNTYALQTSGASSRLIRFNTGEQTSKVMVDLGPHQIIEIAVNPKESNQWAVIVNKRGIQGLWLVSEQSVQEDLQQDPILAFSKGSIYDISWHENGDKLLLTSDHSGTMQIYEYDLQQQQLVQLTQSNYNAFEASYSPDGKRIAFILQKENEQLPAVLEMESFVYNEVDPYLWKPNKDKVAFMERPELGEQVETESQQWEQSSYKTGISWLKPRAVLPVVEEVGRTDSYQIGATLHSGSLIQDQAYSLELTGYEQRLWYDFSYRNKTYYPGFKASIFSEPAFRTLNFSSDQGNFSLPAVRQERSFALSVPLTYNLERNVYFSSFTIEPELRRSQIRYLPTGSGSAFSDFGNLTIGNLFSSLRYKLQQNIRDVQPNTGLVLFGEIEHYFSSTDLIFNVNNQQFRQSFLKPTALRGGFYTYLSPLKQWNQSLRVSLLGITQTAGVFDNQFLVSDGFSESVFPTANNALSLGTRYTVPLIFPDDGGLLLPLYLSNIYLVGFTNTVADASGRITLDQTRTVIGAGIRARFRLSNLALDIGVGVGYEPTRGKTNIFVGNF
ncbi:hypothetical protein G3570_14775 [Balneolaceae bacterium YR4-1]|uniref:WD40-like Beta Propeller Repeat n=1 Tax=Halalkalibaculum roseum TaxID=2709311 RepID=A0A6M1SXU0_9BACT|nr:PD40 domain-containing protein [Halalkalibaculum roseum]NGP77910.1 hypothetical protein [Halalkalibaculum roseum]